MTPLTPAVVAMLAVLCVPLLLHGAPEPAGRPEGASGLKVRAVELLDGEKWTLGEHGLGRPFGLRVVLSNRSEAPLQLWSPDSVEGAACVTIALLSADGNTRLKLSPVVPPRSGIPIATTLAAHKTLRLDFDLLRMIDTHSPPPGRYTVEVTYANALGSAGPVRDVWTGSVQGQPVTIEIVRPAAAP